MKKNTQSAVSGNFFKKAFTLAEVLITLAIIGVVAALTIPTVVRNYQKHQTVTQLKKTYSALANTTNLAIAEYGPIEGWEINESTGAGSENFANKYLIPYLKVQKNCKIQTTGDCTFYISYLNSITTNQLGQNWARFYLTDGTLIIVYNYNEGGIKYVEVYVDLNGQRKPNKVSRDIFYFVYFLNTGKFMPNGYEGSREYLKSLTESGCNPDRNGKYCSTLIMKDGWQIRDDYPW